MYEAKENGRDRVSTVVSGQHGAAKMRSRLTWSERIRDALEAVVTITQGMGKRTVAEFVQNKETIALLRGLGVDFAQGYHICEPLPIDELQLV
jgi:EAL domain-containing protein (putative c-di-GMP-specific phosphodiesterase class I)